MNGRKSPHPEVPVIQAGEVLLKSKDQWLLFARPRRLITTDRLDGVRSALREVEHAVFSQHLYAAGLLSYEAAPAFDDALRVMPSRDVPLLWFGLYPNPLSVSLPTPAGPAPIVNWKPTMERARYGAAIDAVKEHIAQGMTYQVNYTMRLTADFHGDEWGFFLHLVQSQDKYAAYVNTGRHVVCSASPELFFDLDEDVVSARPMKGTVKRGRTTAEDTAQAQWLQADIKNRAENVMIVDMIRNDIGRIAEIGTVHVPELFTIEKYSTLFQMTSAVRARTRASVSDILAAMFPCASITGAPKVSTMNIIARLETTPRKLYTGTIGFISPERRAQFNVAIRTALIDTETGQAEYGVGGGIVWDSSGEDEYNEALLKARVLTEPLHGCSLVETLLWTPEGEYFLLEKHIQRMLDSAEFFGYVLAKQTLERFLDETASAFTSPLRVRVLLDCRGELTGVATGFQPQNTPFRTRLAAKPVDSSNPLLFHKTTRREIYEAALESCPACDEVLLFNERDELTEFTIGNLVVEMHQELVTPPVSCGLLAGTFRAHLVETGQVRERVITKGELRNCSRVYLVNSVRRWVEVELMQ